MRRSLHVTLVVFCSAGVGLIAYLVAIAVGASHTVCQGGASVSYCDTTAGPWALIALAVGAIVGAVAAAAVLRSRKSPSGV